MSAFSARSQLLRAVYRADTETDARQALAEFYATAAAADIPECDRLRRTIRRWEPQVLAYYRSDGLSNAACESTNALIKKIKRVGHGFRNLDNYRLRLLLHCGGPTWHDPPAARIRGRTPTLGCVDPDKDELFTAISGDELPDYMRTDFIQPSGRALPGEGTQALRFFHPGQDDASWGISSSLVRALPEPVTEASDDLDGLLHHKEQTGPAKSPQ